MALTIHDTRRSLLSFPTSVQPTFPRRPIGSVAQRRRVRPCSRRRTAATDRRRARRRSLVEHSRRRPGGFTTAASAWTAFDPTTSRPSAGVQAQGPAPHGAPAARSIAWLEGMETIAHARRLNHATSIAMPSARRRRCCTPGCLAGYVGGRGTAFAAIDLAISEAVDVLITGDLRPRVTWLLDGRSS
jgi:hypothetical protein